MKPLHLIPLIPLLWLAACSRQAAPAVDAAPAYAAVARGRIDVEGGLLKLGAAREGTLASVAVQEGEQVRKGQVLATLDPEPARLQLQASEAALAQARARRDLLDGKLKAARLHAARLAQAARAGAGDGQGSDAAATSVQALAAERAGADAAVAMAVEKRDEARYELGLRTLHAPRAAEVVQVNAQPGTSVSPASGPLFILLPRTPPIVRAELSESYVDAVRAGMPATVDSDDGGTLRNWPAHVLRVGRVVGPSTLDDDPQRASQRTVRCVLAFDRLPPDGARVGQRVLVRFGVPADAAKVR